MWGAPDVHAPDREQGERDGLLVTLRELATSRYSIFLYGVIVGLLVFSAMLTIVAQAELYKAAM